MDWGGRLILAAATCGGVGSIPRAPGTFGSVLGLGACWLLTLLSMPAALVAIACFAGCAVWISQKAEAILDRPDPSQIVIDEVAGMMAALLALPLTPGVWIGGFLFFRFFDILKPFPIRYLEKRCPGGLGIVIDDVIAGAAANLLLRGLIAAGVLPLV
ncbi:MAG: phosphatidylglycerophosphatase A [Desulfosalsimonadaceae bacterium]